MDRFKDKMLSSLEININNRGSFQRILSQLQTKTLFATRMNDIFLATGCERGYQGLRGLEGDADTRVYQILPLHHPQPRPVYPRARQANPRGARTLCLQVSSPYIFPRIHLLCLLLTYLIRINKYIEALIIIFIALFSLLLCYPHYSFRLRYSGFS